MVKMGKIIFEKKKKAGKFGDIYSNNKHSENSQVPNPTDSVQQTI